jgi:hypothetical protein
MSVATFEEMNRAAEVAAAKVRPASILDFEELRQEAWVAVLECMTRYRPERGVPFPGYACKAGVYACQRASWMAIRDHARQALLELDAFEDPVLEEDAGVGFSRREWKREIRREVRRILSEPGIDPDAFRLVLRDATAGEIAAEKGCSTQKVYNDSWEIRRRFRASPILRRLWRER